MYDYKFLISTFAFLFSSPSFAGEFAQPVSIYELLSVPEKYEERTVLVKGFFGSAGYQYGLFPSLNDARISNHGSGIGFSEEIVSSGILEQCKWSYVVLVGRFDVDPRTGTRFFNSIRSASTYGDLESGGKTPKSKNCYRKPK